MIIASINTTFERQTFRNFVKFQQTKWNEQKKIQFLKQKKLTETKQRVRRRRHLASVVATANKLSNWNSIPKFIYHLRDYVTYNET